MTHSMSNNDKKEYENFLIQTGQKGINEAECRRLLTIYHNFIMNPSATKESVDRFLTLINLFISKNSNELEARGVFAEYIAWAIPMKSVIDKIVEISNGKSVLEVAAGNGIWSRLLNLSGVSITATDNLSTHKFYINREFPSIVEDFSAKAAIRKYPSHQILLMIWPPMQSSMAVDALKLFSGDTFIYIGEWRSVEWINSGRRLGCNGTPEFFDELDKNWIEVKTDVKLEQWKYMDDNFHIFTRK